MHVLSIPCLPTRQGWKHFDRGNFKEARQAYNIAVQKNPDNPHCYHLRGQCYLMQGLYEEAMVEFSTAIKVNPRCAGGLPQPPCSRHFLGKRLDTPMLHRSCCGAGDYYGRGDCYRHQGKLDEAMAEYSQALQLDPKFAGACWGRGDCLLAQVSATF